MAPQAMVMNANGYTGPGMIGPPPAVKADAAGRIVKFLADNEEPVMAGQPLAEIA